MTRRAIGVPNLRHIVVTELQPIDPIVARLLSDLPDPEGASLFWARLSAEHPPAVKNLRRDEALFSDVLALAAWSPLLGTTLEQNPAYINWLGRERTLTRAKTQEEFLESLARFALTNTQLDPQTLLARFRRRELLRIYLKDLRDTASIVETTEELSNLADAVLGYALRVADQELNNLYGAPQRLDERGRIGIAEICIIALGKLGSDELNYSSDIDLLFLYSEDGHTSGAGTRGPLTNREYFIKLASAVARIVGQEGGAYRVDLRLRPHGRDGALAVSLEEATKYYRETAHPWELQTLIRARGSAGSATLAARFVAAVRDRVYRRDETVARALAHVRLAKRKIDRHHGPQGRGGYNVKLGSGGIREIEFIAQALQLAYGGHDVWLQAPHTLISLGRLADRRMITESELTNLTEAYVFLRKLEHRLQMEHGLQTHLLPDDSSKRALIARRMHFAGPAALDRFDCELQIHVGHVRAAFARVFGGGNEEVAEHKEVVEEASNVAPVQQPSTVNVSARRAADDADALRETAAIFARHLRPAPDDLSMLAGRIRRTARGSLNLQRALGGIERIAFSLAKLNATFTFDEGKLRALIRLCGASESFAEMIAGNPALISALPRRGEEEDAAALDYASIISAHVGREDNFGAELAALRSVWSRLIVRLAARDAASELSLRESNVRQSALAVASINAGYVIARRELARRLRQHDADLQEGEIPRLAVLGLGRLSGSGLDYGSDLDLVLIYDEQNLSPAETLRAGELMARLAELFVAALSSVTREGQLYRIDLRLRPDGKNGPLVSPRRVFAEYLGTRAAIWEWLAYVKLRSVGGDVDFGREAEEEARRVIHEAAAQVQADDLRRETRRVRERLEKERRAKRRDAIDIKYGAGGMLDVYFATRFLQLKDRVPDEGADRSTLRTLDRLHAAGSLPADAHRDLGEGYALLRRVDHYIRLIVGRSTRLPESDHPALRDIAVRSGFASAAELLARLAEHMRRIRRAYQSIVANDGGS